jgi:hypothetical protein
MQCASGVGDGHAAVEPAGACCMAGPPGLLSCPSPAALQEMDVRQMEAQQQLQERFAELQRQQATTGHGLATGSALRSSLATPRRGLDWGDSAPALAGEQRATPATASTALLTQPDRVQASARSTGAMDRMLGELGRASTMGPPPSRSRTDQLPRATSAGSSGRSALASAQQQSVAALLSSLQATAGKGQGRLARLERVLGTIASDAADSSQVRQAYSNLAVLRRELGDLQLSNEEFGRQLGVVGGKSELAEMKRRLEAQQAIMGRWEESLGQQLELVSALQSPSQRRSMLQQFSSAMKQLDRAAS